MASNLQKDYPIASPRPQPSLFGRLLQENPLTLGLIALALGALVGLLIPETRKENELLGKTRDQLAHQAQETVQEIAQKVGVVAGTAQTAAHEALDKTQEAVREAVTDAIDTVKEEAKQQGLPVEA